MGECGWVDFCGEGTKGILLNVICTHMHPCGALMLRVIDLAEDLLLHTIQELYRQIVVRPVENACHDGACACLYRSGVYCRCSGGFKSGSSVGCPEAAIHFIVVQRKGRIWGGCKTFNAVTGVRTRLYGDKKIVAPERCE